MFSGDNDIWHIMNKGFDVDNDQEPLEENASAGLMEGESSVNWYSWGFKGIDLWHEYEKLHYKSALYPKVDYKP